MAFLTSLPAALAGLVLSFIVAATAQTPPGFHCDSQVPLRLSHGQGWSFRPGGEYRASDMAQGQAQAPSLFLDNNNTQPNQMFTALIMDFSITLLPTQPPAIILDSDDAYLAYAQTSLQATESSNSAALRSQRKPLVPFKTNEEAPTGPHLIVALLFSEPVNSTMPSKLQRQLAETGRREESRAAFDFQHFLALARLGSPVAATWFIINENAKGNGGGSDVTIITPTITKTVTAGASSASSSNIVNATAAPALTSSKALFNATAPTLSAGFSDANGAGIGSGASVTPGASANAGKTAGISANGTATSSSPFSTTAPPNQVATLSAGSRNITSSSSSEDDSESQGGSSLTTLTVNPTAALSGVAGAAGSTGTGSRASPTPSPSQTGVIQVTAAGVREEPAFLGAVAALTLTAGFYWIFL